jgi:hypothetical protein
MNTCDVLKSIGFALLASGRGISPLYNRTQNCHSERSLQSEDLCPIARLFCDESLPRSLEITYRTMFSTVASIRKE